MAIRRNSFVLICVMLAALVFTGCTFFGKDDKAVFIGTVLENDGTTLLVEPQAGSSELRSADKISISIIDTTITDKENKEISLEEIKVGERVEITYNGQIAESYPAQIHKCYKIKLID